MWSAVLAVTLVFYLPGALTFRLPIARREHRARLPTEERVFWYVVTSLAISSVTSLALAALGSYRFDRLLWVNGVLCAGLIAAGRARLQLPSVHGSEPGKRNPGGPKGWSFCAGVGRPSPQAGC